MRYTYEQIVDIANRVQALLSGSKTYIVGGISIILGLYYGDKELVMIGLSAITIRAGIKRDIAK